MNIRVLLFAGLREAAGSREVCVALPDGASVADLRERLALDYPALARLLANAAVAINEEYADATATLNSGDVAAFIPPVSGG
jgi:molybdopterin converting factor subunit 1